MSRTIYLDMDGVIADFSSSFRALNDFYEKQVDQFNPEFFKYVVRRHRIFETLSMYDDANTLIKYLKGMEDIGIADVKLLSSTGREEVYDTATEQKLLWCAKFNIHFPLITVPDHVKKVDYCTGADTILIDDRDDTIELWDEAGGVGVHYVTDCPRSVATTIEHLKNNLL